MPQLSERAAEAMSQEQATALVHVLDLQARWENHRDALPGTLTTADLHARQKAFDAFRVAGLNYTAKYPRAVIPEPTQYVVERMVIWCRTLRAVFRRATGGSPDEVLIKVEFPMSSGQRLAVVLVVRPFVLGWGNVPQ